MRGMTPIIYFQVVRNRIACALRVFVWGGVRSTVVRTTAPELYIFVQGFLEFLCSQRCPAQAFFYGCERADYLVLYYLVVVANYNSYRLARFSSERY